METNGGGACEFCVEFGENEGQGQTPRFPSMGDRPTHLQAFCFISVCVLRFHMSNLHGGFVLILHYVYYLRPKLTDQLTDL